MTHKPLIVISTGDPCGIGPEITARAAADLRVKRACRLLIIGTLPCDATLSRGQECIDLSGWAETLADDPQYRIGMASRKGGLVSFKAVETAAALVMRGKADALVTAPVSKQSWTKAGLPYTGHTEFFEEFCKAPDACMCFSKGKAKVLTVTNHLPLSKIGKALNIPLIVTKTIKFNDTLKRMGIKNPVIGMAGLNPHAGDAGKLGREELTVIAPAIAELKRKGADVRGPLPADVLWAEHLAGKFYAIVTMYHDCALIPLKILPGSAAVHFTAGLPLIRTSPAHGTAFDIAGQNRANPDSMIEAILFAARETQGKRA